MGRATRSICGVLVRRMADAAPSRNGYSRDSLEIINSDGSKIINCNLQLIPIKTEAAGFRFDVTGVVYFASTQGWEFPTFGNVLDAPL